MFVFYLQTFKLEMKLKHAQNWENNNSNKTENTHVRTKPMNK